MPVTFVKEPVISLVTITLNVGGIGTESIATTVYVTPSAQLAAISPRREMPSLILSRPADVFIPGKPVALDVSVISPLQKLVLPTCPY